MKKSIGIFGITLVLTALLFAAVPVSAQIDIPAAVPLCDLEIQKFVNTRLVYVGDSIDYTLVINNHTNNVINHVEVVDTLSAFAEYVDGSASNGGTYDPSSRVLRWDLGSLFGGSEVTLTFRVATDPAGTDTVVVLNRANVFSPYKEAKSNWTITWVKPHLKAILSIEKMADPAIVMPGETVAYHITVVNSGNIAATGISVTDTLPNEAAVIENTITGNGVYDASLHVINWSAASLDPGAMLELDYEAIISNSITDTISIYNIAVIPISEDSTISDTATITVTPEPPVPMITVDKKADVDTVGTGGTINYTITAANLGTGPAADIEVVDAIPAGTELIDGSITAGGVYDPDNNLITWTVDELLSGTFADLGFSVTVIGEYDSYTIIGNRADLYFDEKTYTDTTSTVYRPVFKPELIIEKVAVEDTITSGNLPHFIITVRNTGNASAQEITIVDSLAGWDNFAQNIIPDGVIGPTPNIVTWTIDEIASNDTRTFELSASYTATMPPSYAVDSVVNFVFMYHGEDKFSDTAVAYIPAAPINFTIDKIVDKDSAAIRDFLNYEITVTNISERSLPVTILDHFPQEINVGSDWISNGGYLSGNNFEIIWNIESLGAGNSVKVYFQGQVGSIVGRIDTLINRASVGPVFDRTISDSAITIVYDITQPELHVVKSVDKPIAMVGDTLNYSIEISNTGDDGIIEVPVVDTLPAQTEIIEESIDNNGAYDSESREIRWTLYELEPDDSRTFRFSAIVADDAVVGSTIINTAIIDLPDSTITDTATTIVDEQIGEAKLTIDKTVDKDTVYVGDTLNYNIRIENVGNATSGYIGVSDNFYPALAAIESTINEGGRLEDPPIPNIYWRIDSLRAGEYIDLKFSAITLDINLPEVLATNIADLLYSPVGIISDTVSTVVLERGNVEIDLDKIVFPDSVGVFDTVTYSIIVSNQGEVPFTGQVVDYLPVNIGLIEETITGGGQYDPYQFQIFWLVNNLEPGNSVTFHYNSYTGSSTYHDIDTVMNVASVISFPVADTAYLYVYNPQYPVLTIDKKADKETVSNGEIINYSIDVTNHGGVAAETVSLVDDLPDNAVYIENSAGNGTYDAELHRLSWTLSNIAPDETATVTFQARVVHNSYEDGLVTNIGRVILGDSTIADTVITNVNGNPANFILHVDKEVNRETARAGDQLDYNITLGNTGEGDAVEFTLYDIVPQELQIIDNSISGNGQYDSETGRIGWFIDMLTPEDNMEFSFSGVIRDEVESGIDVMNIAETMVADTSAADTVYTEILPPIEYPFMITKKVDSAVAAPGSVLKYNVLIKNISTEPLSGIIFWDNIPDLTEYVAGSVTGSGRFDAEDNMVRWDWSAASIAPGHTIDLSFKVRIDEDAPDENLVFNRAYAQIDLPGVAKPAQTMLIDTVASNIVQTIVNVPTGPEEDLTIIKSVNFSEAAPGNTLWYTIDVFNPGPDPVATAIVSDDIPNLTSYVAGSASDGGVYNGGTDNIEWTFGPIAVNETVRRTFEVVIDAGATDGQIVRNRANLVAPNPILGNEVTTTVRTGAFLLQKKVSQTLVSPNDTVLYTIIYNNTTGVTANSVMIRDFLNYGINIVETSIGSGGLFQPSTNEVIYNLGDVPAGTIDSVQFRVTISDGIASGTTVDNQARATSTSFSDVLSNVVTFTVIYPNILLSKTCTPSVAAPGDTIAYQILIGNNGTGTISNGIVTDDIPEYFSLVEGSATLNDVPLSVTAGDPIIFDIGDIGPDDNFRLRYRLVVSDDAPFNQEFSNSATASGLDDFGNNVEFGPVSATVFVGQSMLRITKSSNNASGTVGSLIPFVVTVVNISGVTVQNVTITDSMPDAFKLIANSTLINGVRAADPTGTNPYYWNIGDIDAGETIQLQYTIQLTTAAGPGVVENVAWAEGSFGTATVRTANAIAAVNILNYVIPGTIRGRLVIDCDGDKITEAPNNIEGVDIYLDDGSMSRTNEKGMFYFSTVKGGTHVVAVDTRDLEKLGYRLADGIEPSVFVHVNEAGETYVLFRACTMMSLKKEAGLVPKIKVTKTAQLYKDIASDSAGVLVDYEIKIQANEWYSKTLLKVIDSFPDETRLIVHEQQPIIPSEQNNVLTYEVSIEDRQFSQSVYYSLEDLSPGIRRFLTNKIYLEGDVYLDAEHSYPIKSYPTEVSVGPFKRIPPRDIRVNVVGAYFESAKARLLPEAFPVLRAVADTMLKYEDADIRVEGHCDWRPIGTKEFPTNWELSESRAKSVADWLADSAGVAKNRIAYKGFAATEPVDTGWTMPAMDRNRRVEVFVKSFKEGKVDLSQLTQDKWSSFTVLELEPIDIDTSFKMPSRPIETGLADTWEVYLDIDAGGNANPGAIEITDILPATAMYVDGSAEYGDVPIIPVVTEEGKIIFTIDSLKTGVSGITYRVMAPEGSQPQGGGAASLLLKESGKTVNSNSVKF